MHQFACVSIRQDVTQPQYPLTFTVIKEDNQHAHLSSKNEVHAYLYSAKTPTSYIFFYYYIRIAYA